MSEHNVTERLRDLLDERGVEYGWSKEQPDQTWWKDQDGHIYFAKGISNPMLFNFTPEQAVEATLGRGKCRIRLEPMSGYHCTACGELVTMYDANDMLRRVSFCPCCGREVVR